MGLTLAGVVVLVACGLGGAEAAPGVKVRPVGETARAPAPGGAALSACWWLDPRDPAQSLLWCAHAGGTVVSYELTGSVVESVAAPGVAAVAVQPRILLGEKKRVSVLAGVGTEGAGARLWTIDPKTRRAQAVEGRVGTIAARAVALGTRESGEGVLSLGGADGSVEVLVLGGEMKAGSATVRGTAARTVKLAGEVEALAADEAQGLVFAAVKGRGVYAVATAAGAGGAGVEPVLVADSAGCVGVAVIGGKDEGYLLLTHPGSGEVRVHARKAPYALVGACVIEDSASVDGCAGCESICGLADGLGAAFPYGLIAVRDRENTGQEPNFKVVAWEAVAKGFQPPLRSVTGGHGEK